MLVVLQIFRKNARLLARKSTLLLLLAALMVFAGSCSKKIPCPDTGKATKQAKSKKAKAPKKQLTDGDGTEAADPTATADATETAEADNSGTSKPKITGTKNKYNKNGLLQKKKYKYLRSNPARKRSRAKGGILSGLFSGKKKSGGNKPKRSKMNVEPADE